MDLFSHALWSYLIWHALPFPALAILMGILPDLLSFGPGGAYNAFVAAKKRNWRLALRTHAPPRVLQRWRRRVFPVTHSLCVAAAAITLVWLVWGPQWWLLAWPLHILIDIFSHPREIGTPFLWPLSGYRMHGLHWARRTFLAGNAAALLAAYFLWLR